MSVCVCVCVMGGGGGGGGLLAYMQCLILIVDMAIIMS